MTRSLKSLLYACGFNAALLRRLFRSIGLDGDVVSVWGGTSSLRHYYIFDDIPRPTAHAMSFQILDPIGENIAPRDPHFTFHAVAGAGGQLYDASYARIYPVLLFNESLDPATEALVTGNA